MNDPGLRRFMMVVRRALLMIVRHIEQEYDLLPPDEPPAA